MCQITHAHILNNQVRIGQCPSLGQSQDKMGEGGALRELVVAARSPSLLQSHSFSTRSVPVLEDGKREGKDPFFLVLWLHGLANKTSKQRNKMVVCLVWVVVASLPILFCDRSELCFLSCAAARRREPSNATCSAFRSRGKRHGQYTTYRETEAKNLAAYSRPDMYEQMWGCADKRGRCRILNGKHFSAVA